MNKQEFKERLLLSPQPENADRFCIPDSVAHYKKYRESAVLIPAHEKNGEIHLLFTQRPFHLKHHPGQVCFPGGKISECDQSYFHTALRETEEEIGITSNNIEILGSLPVQHTYTGFKVFPVIALINDLSSLKLDPNEVSRCFSIPISEFFNALNRSEIRTSQQGIEYEVLVLHSQGEYIWGITASIIDVLVRKVSNN
ncbi:CoA pyrophosphatase [Shewanella sp. 202IG2-18]|uniref:NUDIX hydrolase n=1 Tax=Parashewanella hymeniacidonis TaxID=2807618 RepID=UPI00196048C2|nr:CoA pyrophosphatase [Parashewanella hymeniacidonis]MBM7073628.1 CoA pyrophosphatase [Parashewanella hymeniacidonis]